MLTFLHLKAKPSATEIGYTEKSKDRTGILENGTFWESLLW